VLRRDSTDSRAPFTLGDLYVTKGDAKRALPFLEMATRDYPAEFDTRFALVARWFKLDRLSGEFRNCARRFGSAIPSLTDTSI
jgi:hypothetical protein